MKFFVYPECFAKELKMFKNMIEIIRYEIEESEDIDLEIEFKPIIEKLNCKIETYSRMAKENEKEKTGEGEK
jgi:hypothetical protein